VILSCLDELSSLKEGLKSLGVLNALMEHSFLLEEFYCNSVEVRSPEEKLSIFLKSFTILIKEAMREIKRNNRRCSL
jgi:hypothetical protein